MSEIDRFESRIPMEQLETLLDLGVEFDFDPTASIQIEEYFVNLLKDFNGSQKDFERWVRSIITTSFRCLTERPRWIQGANWQMSKMGPMLFVGQIDCPAVENVLHDSTSFYTFLEPISGEIRTILQIG